MGLFLGYALLHVPDFVLFLYRWLAQNIPIILNIIKSRTHRQISAQENVESGIEPNEKRRKRGDRKGDAETRVESGKKV